MENKKEDIDDKPTEITELGHGSSDGTEVDDTQLVPYKRDVPETGIKEEKYPPCSHTYLDFLLDPSRFTPLRMPVKQGFPTVITSFKTIVTVPVRAAGVLVGYFAPQNPLCGFIDSSAYRTDLLVIGQDQVPAANSSWAGQYIGNSSYYSANNSFPHLQYFKSGRVIAGQLRINYTGKQDVTAGSILVSGYVIGQGSRYIGSLTAMAGNAGGVTYGPPSIQQMANCDIFRRFGMDEQVTIKWFPVDDTCRNFQPFDAPLDNVPNIPMSQMAFVFNINGATPGSNFEFSYESYYEVVPNIQSSPMFSASQGYSQENWQSVWTTIGNMARDPVRQTQILISGVK